MLDMVPTREPGVASSSGSSRAVSAKWPRWFTPNCISTPSRGAGLVDRHEPGVVDEQVEPPGAGGGERGDAVEVGQVQRADLDLRRPVCAAG